MDGFRTVMLFGAVFTELKKGDVDGRTLAHEETHVHQYADCFGVGFAVAVVALFALLGFGVRGYGLWALALLPLLLFYVIYGAEWLYLRLFRGMAARDAYREIGFERQARWIAETWDAPCSMRRQYTSLSWWKRVGN